MTHQRALNAVNNLPSFRGGGNGYLKIDLGIKSSDNETRNLMRDVWGGFIKNNLEVIYNGLGLDPNVTNDIAKIVNDPNMGFESHGKRYIPHSAVGNMRPNNLDGMPTGGCFTMTALA
jgi:hypothetical protein